MSASAAAGFPRQPIPRGARSRVLRFVTDAAWRSELTVVREFRGTYAESVVEDVLFELVLKRRLEWFGAEDPNSHLPLRYRAARRSMGKPSKGAP